jgi:hypothetical protein
VQTEAVRSGQSDASTLSAILTQQVLQQCSVAQLAADVAYLQQAADEQQQQGNHVALAFYQQLTAVCKVRWLCKQTLRSMECLCHSSSVSVLLCMGPQATASTAVTEAGHYWCLAGCLAFCMTSLTAWVLTQLWIAMQALLPADGSAQGLLPTLQCSSSAGQPAAEPVVPAADLLADMTGSNKSSNERLHAGLAMVAALATDAAILPVNLAEAAAAVELPNTSAEDILLLQPAAAASCLQAVLAPAKESARHPEADAEQASLLRQAAACLLQFGIAAEPAAAAALGTCQGCLSGLTKLVAAGSTSSSTPAAVKVSVLQLLHSLANSAANSTATAPPSSSSRTRCCSTWGFSTSGSLPGQGACAAAQGHPVLGAAAWRGAGGQGQACNSHCSFSVPAGPLTIAVITS